MPVIGITGGIASGKSTVARLLISHLSASYKKEVKFFSADAYNHELLKKDPVVREEIIAYFGNKVVGENGRIDRTLLGQVVFAEISSRKALESILHPKIREEWITKSKQFRLGKKYFVAEIPLLYETQCDSYFDCIVVVEADTQVQLERLSLKRGLALEMARQVIAAQLPSQEKMQRADILILNDHTEKLLHHQIELAARALLMRYA